MEIMRAQVGHALTNPGPNVTGQGWGDPPIATEAGQRIGNVFFTPGSRTYWHRHDVGQVLVVLEGQGLISAGDAPQRICAGDKVWIPGGERHWHGAAPDSVMVHLAVTLGPTEWLEEVAEEDYRAVAEAVATT